MAEPLQNFVTKWGGVPISSPQVAALRKIDERRLATGKNPWTIPQTQRGFMAATTRQPGVGSTPMPTRNPMSIWSNALTDVQQLVKGIPQLPMALVNEAKMLTDAPQSRGKLQGDQIGDYLQLPGVRLLPGAFVGSALLPGGLAPEEALTRPVSSALDILPYISGGLKANVGRSLRKFDVPERGAQFAAPPYTRPGTVSSGVNAADILSNWKSISEGRQMPLADRLGLQGAVALSDGRRLIPDMLVNKVDPLVTGSRVVERGWREAMGGSNLGGKLLQMSSQVRGLNSLTKGIEANEIRMGRQTDAFVGGKQLHEQFIEEFGNTPEAAGAWTDISRVIQDPHSFSPQNLTPKDAIGNLAPKYQKYVTQYVDELLPSLQEQLLAAPDPSLNISVQPYIGRWVDGQIYTQADLAKLKSSQANALTKAQQAADPALFKRVTDSVEAAHPGLTKLVGNADAEALLRGTGKGWRRRLQTLQEYEALLNEVEKFRSGGTGLQYNKLNTGALDEAFRLAQRPGTLARDAFKKAYQEAGGAAKSFERTKARTLPASLSRTGSRLMRDMFESNLKHATDLKAELLRTRPDLLDKFKQMQDLYAAADTPGALTSEARVAVMEDIARIRGELVQQMGSEYRYLHYTTPGDPKWINWDEQMQRQNMSSLMTRQERNRLYGEVRETLNDLRNKGYEPVYVPGVAVEKLADVDMTTVANTYKTPAFAKERSFDYAPMTDDLGLSVSYAALQDYLSRRAIPYMIDSIQRQYGISGLDLNRMLQAKAHATWSRKPELRSEYASFADFEQSYINSMQLGQNPRYVQFNPDEMFPLNRESPTAAVQEQVWLPREMASVLERSFSESTSYFQKLFEPITNTFRVSVLLFSPAWHWNNIMGNGFITGLANPRAFLYMAEQFGWMGGWEGLKQAGRAGQDISTAGTVTGARGVGFFDEAMETAGLPGSTGAVENLAIDISRKKGVNVLNNNMSRAKTATRILDEIQQSKTGQAVGNAYRKMTGGSLSINAFFDDLARRTNFRAFYEKKYSQLADEVAQGGKAMTPDEMIRIAGEHALRSTQDWIMDWTQLLPVERGILRAVFPFYSFMSHIFRAAIKFPFDHPLRVATINAFTRAEIEDWQSNYPQVFRKLLGMPVDENTDQWTALNVDSFNPFRDVGNMLSFGFMASSANPLIATALEAMGVDTMSGAPEFAPNFIYDPVAPGGQVFDNGNPIINLAKNMMPQAKAVSQWMGLDADFREYEASDPEGARRALMSGLRMPVIWRSIDVNEQVARDEVKRFDDYRKAVGEMDISRVGRYDPAMAQTLSAFSQAQEANPALAQMTPTEWAEAVVKGGGGPPANPLSAFVTV